MAVVTLLEKLLVIRISFKEETYFYLFHTKQIFDEFINTSRSLIKKIYFSILFSFITIKYKNVFLKIRFKNEILNKLRSRNYSKCSHQIF